MKEVKNFSYKEYHDIFHKGISINEIYEDYLLSGSIWKTGERFKIKGQTVYSILKKNFNVKFKRRWTEGERKQLVELFTTGFECGDGKLDNLCESLNRLKSNICREARKLGLTNRHRKPSVAQCDRISRQTKQRVSINHPRGFLGRKHSVQVKEDASKRSIKMWSDPNHTLNSESHKQQLSDRFSALMKLRMKGHNIYSRGKHGTVEIGGKVFFARSGWEANYAAYLQFLKDNKLIKDWFHEPETFWFYEIKRGVRSYLPDFKIIENDDSFWFSEVKGYMDKKSITKINRMRKYYPNIKLEVIDKDKYKEIAKKKSLIPNWGVLDNMPSTLPVKKCSIENCNAKFSAKGYCSKHYYQFIAKAS